MKTIIYYYTKTNNSKDYASSLSSRIDCDYYFYNKMKYKEMCKFDTIIFVSPVHNNKICHLKNFLKHYKKLINLNKNLIIVAVGMSPKTPDRRESLIITNLLDEYHIRLYELTGGFNASKLPFYMRFMLKIGLKIASKNDENAKNMLNSGAMNILNTPYNYNDYDGIEKIMNTIRKLEYQSNNLKN